MYVSYPPPNLHHHSGLEKHQDRLSPVPVSQRTDFDCSSYVKKTSPDGSRSVFANKRYSFAPENVSRVSKDAQGKDTPISEAGSRKLFEAFAALETSVSLPTNISPHPKRQYERKQCDVGSHFTGERPSTAVDAHSSQQITGDTVTPKEADGSEARDFLEAKKCLTKKLSSLMEANAAGDAVGAFKSVKGSSSDGRYANASKAVDLKASNINKNIDSAFVHPVRFPDRQSLLMHQRTSAHYGEKAGRRNPVSGARNSNDGLQYNSSDTAAMFYRRQSPDKTEMPLLHMLPSIDKEVQQLLNLGEELASCQQVNGEWRKPAITERKRTTTHDSCQTFSSPRADGHCPHAITQNNDQASVKYEVRSNVSRQLRNEAVDEKCAISRGDSNHAVRSALRGKALEEASKKIDELLNMAKLKQGGSSYAVGVVDKVAEVERKFGTWNSVRTRQPQPVQDESATQLSSVTLSKDLKLNGVLFRRPSKQRSDEYMRRSFYQPPKDLASVLSIRRSGSSQENVTDSLADKQPITKRRSYIKEKMDYTKKWLENEFDLKSFKSSAATTTKPDLLQFENDLVYDSDERSLGSASAEVAAITKRKHFVASLPIPDIVPYSYKISAKTGTGNSKYDEFVEREKTQTENMTVDAVYQKCQPSPLWSTNKKTVGKVVSPGKLQLQPPLFISPSMDRTYTLPIRDLGVVKRRVEAFDRMSSDDSVSGMSSSDNVAYSSKVRNARNRLSLSTSMLSFIRKFEERSGTFPMQSKWRNDRHTSEINSHRGDETSLRRRSTESLPIMTKAARSCKSSSSSQQTLEHLPLNSDNDGFVLAAPWAKDFSTESTDLRLAGSNSSNVSVNKSRTTSGVSVAPTLLDVDNLVAELQLNTEQVDDLQDQQFPLEPLSTVEQDRNGGRLNSSQRRRVYRVVKTDSKDKYDNRTSDSDFDATRQSVRSDANGPAKIAASAYSRFSVIQGNDVKQATPASASSKFIAHSEQQSSHCKGTQGCCVARSEAISSNRIVPRETSSQLLSARMLINVPCSKEHQAKSAQRPYLETVALQPTVEKHILADPRKSEGGAIAASTRATTNRSCSEKDENPIVEKSSIRNIFQRLIGSSRYQYPTKSIRDVSDINSNPVMKVFRNPDALVDSHSDNKKQPNKPFSTVDMGPVETGFTKLEKLSTNMKKPKPEKFQEGKICVCFVFNMSH
ncbi:unnamed protein product [Soboliphyme baturini]|uniref:RING-type domain-containing protein n=1 Tax=Soboliphyme baturini TaxID=241478 RepID=A0A183IZ74_9BILA|nr:unnamed protein product [Soboliphyme baturini]